MKTLAVTRPTGEGADTASFIRKQGWTPLVFHTVELKPRPPSQVLRELRRTVHQGPPDWVVFMSPRGVGQFSRALRGQALGGTIFKGSRVVAVGPKTRSALKQLAKKAEMPKEYTSDGVAAYLSSFHLDGKRVVLARSGQGSEILDRRLRSLGALVTTIRLYDSTIPDDGRTVSRFLDRLSSGRVDATLFTSSLSAANLFKMARREFSPSELRKLLGKSVVGAIGPTTASELRRLGVKVSLVPERYLIDQAVSGLLNAVGSP